jgi:hypothetical protein
LEFFGGAPAAFVPDNLKSGVDKPHRYDPELNRAYGPRAANDDRHDRQCRARGSRESAGVELAESRLRDERSLREEHQCLTSGCSFDETPRVDRASLSIEPIDEFGADAP